MAITVGIFQQSGGGKTMSIVVGPDGTYDIKGEYKGMNPSTTVYINSDRKFPPFKLDNWKEGVNMFTTSDVEIIMDLLQKINNGTKIKSVIIDTINGIMIDKEMLESKKLTYDKWMDLAKDIYEIITFANSMRNDLIIYFMGHVTLYTDVDGNESKCLVTNGRKLEKIKVESKLPVVLFGAVERGLNGDNKYYFETQSNRSTAKTPPGMFEDFKIPNSLVYVDTKIREYYGI
ncbi:MAG TPA: AAA family ATPase [Candidatus Dojkabacteria bacterium]|nr:AAA family ATPase [Candidatus Dojkabacteria bacterium]